jgi:FecR-like protein/putative zinc finger protein
MFSRHVGKQLSAYCHGELSDQQSRDVSEHLVACERCRAEYEQISFGIRLAEQLPQASAPASMWGEIEALLDRQSQDRELRGQITGRRWTLTWPQLAAAAGVFVIFLGIGALLYYRASLREGWKVDPTGVVRIGNDNVDTASKLGIGQVLETGSNSSAKIDVANIGEVELEPHTRVTLVKTQLTEHRLSLERGRMHARIWAPPKLFYVNTPSAEAIDLGCAYTLTVDDTGAALLEVTRGWVELVSHGGWSRVPGDAICVTRPGYAPGTPRFQDASTVLIDALSAFDFQNAGEESVDLVLSEARPRDSLTLWHLLFRVNPSLREKVYDRLVALVPPPRDVNRDGVMRLDETMIEEWVREMNQVWY